MSSPKTRPRRAGQAHEGLCSDHLRRVAQLSAAIGARLGLRSAALSTLWAGALLHDIGKLGVDASILAKPGRLTAEEYEAVQRHTLIGEWIARAHTGDLAVARVVRHHHERWDGLGYPDSLRAQAIPLGARIVAVADAFDAMTTQRPYNQPLTPAEAASTLADGAGAFWDPRIVAALGAHLAAAGSA